jgi:predicted membrane metal-binding protein
MLTIAIVVFVLWLLGLFFFKAAKGLIHLLLLAAVVIALFHFFGGG